MGKRYNLFKRFGQRGQSILMVALSLPIFMFLLAIVFDAGMYFVQASKLQNVADSAALAGVAVYTNKTKTNLIAKPTDEFDESFTKKGLSGYEYAFDPIDDKADADAKAAMYIKTNSNDELTLDANGESGLWYAPYITTLVDGSKATYNGIYVYRVDLKEEVPLNFAKYFGLDWFDVKASATALAYYDPDPEENIDDLIKVINANIYKTAPNLYWESIYNSSSNKKYSVTSTDESTGEVTTKDGEVYGRANDRYFTTTITDYTSDNDLTTAAGLDDNTLAWKAGSDKFCAEPIYGNDQLGLKTLVYTINKTFVQDKTSTKKEATSIFIDRPNTQSGGLGTPYRACVINITGDKLSDDEDTPLYMRVESEPILVNSQAMLVQPLTINIKAYQKKPMIIAYDGPDPNRDKDDTPCVDINTGMVYKWAWYNKVGRNVWKETYSSGYEQFSYYFEDGASNLVYTSETTSAPITVNLDHNFRGVVYAPYSKVIIYGPGAIDGFIMAAEIEDYGTSGTRRTHKTVSSIPNWGASYDGGDTWFKYDVFKVTAEYNVIYDDFTNYTWTDLGGGV